MPLTIKKSKQGFKRYVARDEKRTIHFADRRYRNYVLMNDPNSKYYEPNKEEREKTRSAYRKRHAGDNLNNPFSPGALSYYLLWSAPTLKGGAKEYEKKFNIKVLF
tara:strand:- start:1004 stop:1321 length:318 start_codon:yes stop_codon:yes gene_type:complete